MASQDGPTLFGELLQRHRVAAGLSQEELAERAMLSRRGISDLERGERRMPHPATVRRLADALQLEGAERAGLVDAARAGLPTNELSTRAQQMPPVSAVPTLPSEQPREAEPVEFGELLRRGRADARMTQRVLAEKAGVSVRALSDLERGIRRSPYLQTLTRLLDALGLNETNRASLEATALRLAALRSAQPIQSAMARANVRMPVQLTSFVGRDQETAEIRRLLAQTRLLTLAGPGGVGKTRLALRVAEEELDSYPDGVWVVELASITEATVVVQAVATVFNLREKTAEPLIATLIKTLEAQRLLLVLDNCEHLLASCADLVHRLLRACPHMVILCTSREILRLSAETIWRVPPLGLGNCADEVQRTDQLVEYEAVALFVERARAIQPDFVATRQNLPTLLGVCQRVDGIPLAIELAASRIKVLGLEQIAERLGEQLQFLTSRDPTIEARQQTLETTIWWSYNLLTPDEQSLFDRVSVFAGGWSLDAMEAVARGDVGDRHRLLDVLERLIDKSLVLADAVYDRPRRYRLLEPVRQFARDRLHERSEARATQDRHAAFFLELFERAEQVGTTVGPTPAWPILLDPEQDNLRLALRWYIEQGQIELAQRLAAAARWYWFYRAHLAEGRRWLEEVLALDSANQQEERLTAAPHASVRPTVETAMSEEDARRLSSRAKALTSLGLLAATQGDLKVAEQASQGSLDLHRRLGDVRGCARPLSWLGRVSELRADFDTARNFLEEARTICQQTRQASVLQPVLVWLAEIASEDGRVAEAVELALEALRMAKVGNQTMPICHAATIVGELQYRLGRRETAGQTWQEALARARQTHQKHASMVRLLIDRGRLAVEQGETTRGRSLLAEGLTSAHELSRWELARGLETIVEMAVCEGDARCELRLAGAAAALRDALATPLWPSERDRLNIALDRARQKLCEADADAAWLLGWSTAPDQALAFALDLLNDTSSPATGDLHPPRLLSAASSGP